MKPGFHTILKVFTYLCKIIDLVTNIGYIFGNRQTGEAEITADMISKRVRAGESRAEAQSVKWTAEGRVKTIVSIL